MKKEMMKLLSLVCMALLLQNCASVSGLDEARTVDKGNMEIVGSLNWNQFPELTTSSEDLDFLGGGFPNLDLSFKYGVLENLDVGARVTSNLNIGFFAKAQLLGGKSEQFALGTGLEVGTALGLLYNVQVPIYVSVYPTQKIAINFNPRFIYQTAIEANGDNLLYLGGNTSILFGTKNKFGIDLGLYRLSASGTVGSTPYLNIGVGGKFRIGDYDSSETKELNARDRRRRR